MKIKAARTDIEQLIAICHLGGGLNAAPGGIAWRHCRPAGFFFGGGSKSPEAPTCTILAHLTNASFTFG